LGKYLDIARRLEREKGESLDRRIPLIEPDVIEPVEGGIDFASLLTDTEREQYFKLLESMTEREAGAIIARNRQPLQIQQALQDYKKYGYIKIFSTVLSKAIYFAKDERAAQDVPDPNIPVFLEADIQAVKGLSVEETKVLLEARILFGGPIKRVEDCREPPSSEQ